MPCTAEKPAAGSGRHAIQGHISPKSSKDRQTACPFLLLCLGQEAPEGLEGRGQCHLPCQGGGIGRAIISALLPLLPQGAQLLCVGTNAMATAAMLKAGAQRGATGENAVRWAAQNADILIAPIALVLKDSMMGEITGDIAASVGSSRATRILVPTERCGTHVAGAHGVSMQALVEDAARQAAAMAAGA